MHLSLLRIFRFTFKGGNNVTLKGSTDPNWGWVDGHGQAVSKVIYLGIGSLCIQTVSSQWWDAMQQTNRPHGWAFSKIKKGTIRDMKLWKASRAKYGQRRVYLLKVSIAHRVEFCYERLL